MNNQSLVLQKVCDALLEGNSTRAAEIASGEYPFLAQSATGRRYNETVCTRVFVRDGFIDRYSGQRLVFPAVLRMLSQLLPAEFPFHLNWKMSECHLAYWELFPTIDHVVPIARGGSGDEENLVSTSMIHNSAKSNWTLKELGWTLSLPGDYCDWDGLVGWFLKYTELHSEHLKNNYMKRWHKAALLTR